jgi:hypothetical protein
VVSVIKPICNIPGINQTRGVRHSNFAETRGIIVFVAFENGICPATNIVAEELKCPPLCKVEMSN